MSSWIPEFPNARPRRLRQSAALRRLVSETRLHPDQLVLPYFVRSGRKTRQSVSSMPAVYQLSVDELLRDTEKAHATGVGAGLLFGIPEKKDAKATGAYAANGIVQRSIRELKKAFPELLVITDVCLCEYMSHGHCGIVSKTSGTHRILNDPSLKLLAQTAMSHAEAGAD